MKFPKSQTNPNYFLIQNFSNPWTFKIIKVSEDQKKIKVVEILHVDVVKNIYPTPHSIHILNKSIMEFSQREHIHKIHTRDTEAVLQKKFHSKIFNYYLN